MGISVQLFPLIAVPQILFTGIFLSIDAIPSWIRWIQFLCPLKYAVNLMFIVEFQPDKCTFACSDDDSVCINAALANCQRILDSIDVQPEKKGTYAAILIALFVLYRVGGLMLLRSKAKTVY